MKNWRDASFPLLFDTNFAWGDANIDSKKMDLQNIATHELGHGIGLQDHDFPTGINKKSNWVLREKMCLAIEPAVYGKFGGIRIEDNYLIERNSCKNLSIAPKELIEI